VLVEYIEAEGFLVYGEMARLDLGSGVTVVTGPNGAGKTTLGRCLELARAAIGRAADDPAVSRLGLYEEAGYEGAGSFAVRLGLCLDQPGERRLVRAFVCAGFATAYRSPSPGQLDAGELDAMARSWLVEDSLTPLWSGSLLVRFDAGMSRPWYAAWEFAHARESWHVVLSGSGEGQLRAGRAEESAQPGGSVSLTDWLLASKPGDEHSMDFRVALQALPQPVAFSVQTPTGGAGAIPESLRELAAGLGIADYRNRSFGFDQVLSALLQRGIVLTDNRRLPLTRWFPFEELGGPVDLRDGEGVAAELFRLKTGDASMRERFEAIRATFHRITGRVLDVRAWPAASADSGPGMIIEPVVVSGRAERPVEFSGAGVQEALVLCVLLVGETGRFLLLDEPALNLEATVQRRLISGLPADSQYLVITHSAELVPFDEPEDLGRIVRLNPGPMGTEIRRPLLGNLPVKQSLRWLQLLEPAEVRALLFAAGVILCEGPTDAGALRRWWRGAAKVGLPAPGDANIPVISVDGQNNYGPYLRLLHAFGIPWAVVADGPALRRTSQLAKDLDNLGLLPDTLPDDEDDFASCREAWESAGVFSFAVQFGDDHGKGGEFEVFLRDIDEGLFDRIRAELGRSKPRVGARFAAEHPEPPAAVLEMYTRIASRLGPVVMRQTG